MLIFVTLPTRSILTTRPSAGETMMRGSAGMVRGGLRKKKATKTANNSTRMAAMTRPSAYARMADTSSGIRNRYASLTIIERVWRDFQIAADDADCTDSV